MELKLIEDQIVNDILRKCKQLFGFKVCEVIPIKRGWLNLKWKVITDKGDFLIKQYNKERFKLYNRTELSFALSQQIRLYNQRLPCPKLISFEGNLMFESDNGELFIVMNYCEGVNVPPGKLTIEQMEDLGRVTGKMHQIINDGTLPDRNRPEFILPSLKKRLEHWETVRKDVIDTNKEKLVAIIDLQYKITEFVDLDDLALTETGWAHRDLWVDNLLFKEKHISAVLDFDRLKYDFPPLDVARAIISGALNENYFDVDLVRAFVQGYRESYLFEADHLIRSLKLLWFMESPWWIRSNMEQHSGPPLRFSKEMIWLSENYRELDSLLKNI